tara:strand:- start:6981 stop:9833 length:2853 start_codon:yes stop_codon:yes gene_type:complete
MATGQIAEYADYEKKLKKQVGAGKAAATAQIDKQPKTQNPGMQPMSGDSPFGGEDPITDNLDTSMHGVGGTAINSGANAGISVNAVDGAGADYEPGTTYAPDPNVGQLPDEPLPQSMPGANPMYYRDEFIDPLIKQDIMGRDYQDLTGQTSTASAANIDVMNQQSSAGRLAQLSQLGMLQGIASGKMSPAIQQQRDRATQDALAMMATQRGGPTSAAMRIGMQGISEAGRSATEAAARQQLEATQMLGQAAGQLRGQDFTAANAQAQFQQQTNLSNAQMQNEMVKAESQVNAQLEGQRDNMMQSLIGMGVDRDVAILQVNNELARLKEELTYKYWAGKLGAFTQVTERVIEATGGSEDMFEQIQEEGAVPNIFGQYQTPYGYNVPGSVIAGEIGYEDPDVDPWGETTWSNPEDQGTSNFGWYRDPNTGQWVLSGAEAKENITHVGTVDEYGRKREGSNFGQIQNQQDFMSPVSATNPMAQQSTVGNVKLGEVNKGLRPSGQQINAINQKMGNLQGAINATPDPSRQSGFKSGAGTVRDALEFGAVGGAFAGAMAGDEEDRKQGIQDLAQYGAQKGLEQAVEETSEYFDEAAKEAAIAKSVQDKAAASAAVGGEAAAGEVAEKLTQEAAAESSAITAAQAAPYIGGGLQFLSQTLTGDDIGAALVDATAGLGGALGGGLLAAEVGAAVATGAASGAAGGATAGTAALPGLGTLIGTGLGASAGAIGAGLAGAAAKPLSDLARTDDKRFTPSEGFVETAATVGLPGLKGTQSIEDRVPLTESGPGRDYSQLGIGERRDSRNVFSGLETKSHIENTGVQPVSSSIAGYKPIYETYDSGGYDAFGEQGYGISDKDAKSSIGKSEDELSDFLRELNPVKYDYKPEYGGEKDQYGIIAQDAQKTPVGDSFVKQNGNGTHMIDTGKATMVNMAALANQQKILDKQGMLIAELLKGRG